MEILKRKSTDKQMPVKVLMFGEGNFLRAFAAFAVQKMKEGGYNGYVTAVQGIENGLSGMINAQDGLYTVIEKGVEGGDVVERYTLIDVLKECINPYEDYNALLAEARNSELQAIISNTTEFGICYESGQDRSARPIKNFPAKLTDFLYERFTYFKGDKEKGVVILPCELIDRNGDKLKEFVLKYAKDWKLGSDFTDWLSNSCDFTNTLVDRIVSGYPKNEAAEICKKLGYTDNLLDVCEPFMLWVIEGKNRILEKLPLTLSGLNIIVTDDLQFYRTRKVRILNGAHTMSVLAGHLCGFEFVDQLVGDELFSKYIQKGIFNEIIPAMHSGDMESYANSVIERFKNPFLNHRLLSISLNSVSKFKTRVLPSIEDYVKKFGNSPKILSFSMAALIKFYKGGIDKFVQDEPDIIAEFKRIFAGENHVNAVLKNTDFWGGDLTEIKGFESQVKKYYDKLISMPVVGAVREVIE